MGMNQDRQITSRERAGIAGMLVALGALALLYQGCAVPSCQAPSQPRGYQPTDELAVFQIDAGDEASCSAWKLAGPLDLLVTANHCCEHAAEQSIVIHGKTDRLWPVAADPVGDVCLLSGPAPGQGLELAKQDPQVGSTVWMRGYPHERLAVSQGLWSGLDSDGDCGATLYAGPGASGAPIVDAQGHVVCVVTAYPHTGPGLSIGCPAVRVRVMVNHYYDPSDDPFPL